MSERICAREGCGKIVVGPPCKKYCIQDCASRAAIEKWRQANPDRVRARKREWKHKYRLANPEKERNRKRHQQYRDAEMTFAFIETLTAIEEKLNERPDQDAAAG